MEDQIITLCATKKHSDHIFELTKEESIVNNKRLFTLDTGGKPLHGQNGICYLKIRCGDFASLITDGKWPYPLGDERAFIQNKHDRSLVLNVLTQMRMKHYLDADRFPCYHKNFTDNNLPHPMLPPIQRCSKLMPPTEYNNPINYAEPRSDKFLSTTLRKCCEKHQKEAIERTVRNFGYLYLLPPEQVKDNKDDLPWVVSIYLTKELDGEVTENSPKLYDLSERQVAKLIYNGIWHESLEHKWISTDFAEHIREVIYEMMASPEDPNGPIDYHRHYNGPPMYHPLFHDKLLNEEVD